MIKSYLKNFLRSILTDHQYRWVKKSFSFAYHKSGLFWIFFFIDLVRLSLLRNNSEYRSPVILCIANPSSLGGTELQIQIISQALKKRLGNCLVLIGGSVALGKMSIFLKRLDELKIPYILLRNVGVVNYYKFPILKRLVSPIFKRVVGRARISHFFNPVSAFLTPVFKDLGLKVCFMETGLPDRQEWWLRLEYSVGDFNSVTSVSKRGIDRLKTLFGYNGPTEVIPTMIFPPTSEWVKKRPSNGSFNIVYLGRICPRKGIENLIRAVSAIKDTVPEGKLSLYGTGELLLQMRGLVSSLGIGDRVTFYGEFRDEDLYTHLAKGDLFCLPSESEGMPCSILEAMSIGLPILATNVGGIPEMIEHNVSGYLIPPFDLGALGNGLIHLAKDPDLRIGLGKGAAEAFAKRGGIDGSIKKLLALYDL